MIGEIEQKTVEGLFTFFNEYPMVFDVGSNKCGWSDVILKEYNSKCQLHLFEPIDKLRSFAEVKYEYRDNVIYNSDAVHSESGLKIPFYYFDNFNNELSSIYKQDWWETELPLKEKQVTTITIDDYCSKYNIEQVDCIKIDTEGNDPLVIKGCKDLLSQSKIKFIITEYGGHYKISGQTFKSVIEFVNSFGYKVYQYEPIKDNYNEVKLEDFVEDYDAQDFVITKEEIHTYSIDGWNVEFVKSVLDLEPINFYLEIGCFEGFATKWVCENLLEEGGRCIVVDPLEDYYIKGDVEYPFFVGQYQRFLRTTKGLPIELKRMKSIEAYDNMRAFRFDLIYIDGDHREESVYNDGVNCFSILKVGGHLLFDDYHYWREDTTRGIDRFLNEYAGRYDVVKSGYQILIKKTS